jgi:hypothetical protein
VSAEFLKSAHNAQAIIFFVLGLLLQLLFNFSPLLLGVVVALEDGPWRGLLTVVVGYIALGFFLAFWPLGVLAVFVTVWLESGFVDALATTTLYSAVVLVLLMGPTWLLYKAERAAAAARYHESIALGVVDDDAGPVIGFAQQAPPIDDLQPEGTTEGEGENPGMKVLLCPSCGAKNRVITSMRATAICGKCRNAL